MEGHSVRSLPQVHGIALAVLNHSIVQSFDLVSFFHHFAAEVDNFFEGILDVVDFDYISRVKAGVVGLFGFQVAISE